MEFFELVRQRRSVRAYRPEEPPQASLDAVLEAVRTAPSAGNLQAFRIKVVRDKEVLGALAAAAYGQHFIASAPLLLSFAADPGASQRQYGQRGGQLYAIQDATIACVFAHLAAAAAGLGSAWVGAFSPSDVARILQLPEGLIPVALLPLGYPAEVPEATPRKTVVELLL